VTGEEEKKITKEKQKQFSSAFWFYWSQWRPPAWRCTRSRASAEGMSRSARHMFGRPGQSPPVFLFVFFFFKFLFCVVISLSLSLSLSRSVALPVEGPRVLGAAKLL
jgi:hypothetical protein